MIERFTKYNKYDFDEICRMKNEFYGMINNISLKAEVSLDPIKKILESSQYYLQSSLIEQKLIGLSFLKKEIKLENLSTISIYNS